VPPNRAELRPKLRPGKITRYPAHGFEVVVGDGSNTSIKYSIAAAPLPATMLLLGELFRDQAGSVTELALKCTQAFARTREARHVNVTHRRHRRRS
jgi:hypothetical protein